MIDIRSLILNKIENIMTGEESPGLLGPPLALAESVYRYGVGVRNGFYDRGVYVAEKAICKIISVGALTVGGAGKTPFTMLIAHELRQRGVKTGILSRGYGAKNKLNYYTVSDGKILGDPPPETADEPYMMARALKGVPVACAPDRIYGAREMVKLFDVAAIILDDGFQRRSIHRDLDILLVDAKNPFGATGRLLPLGELREPVASAIRADIIVATSHNEVSDEAFDAVKKSMADACGEEKPMLLARGVIDGFATLSGKKIKEVASPVFAFAGISHPKRFTEALKPFGVEVAGFETFTDHHQFTEADIDRLTRRAKELGAASLLTTEKDAVRLLSLKDKFINTPCCYATYRMTVVKGEETLKEHLDRFE